MFQPNSVRFGQGLISAVSCILEKFFRTPTYPSHKCPILEILAISETMGITEVSLE